MTNKDEWRKTTLGEAAVLSAKTVSPSESGDVPYVGLEHIAPGALRLSGNGAASDVASAKTRFQKGDILFGKLRPYFRKAAIAPFDGICSTDIWVVKPAEGVDARYLFYTMANQDFVDTATRESVGTRMPRAKWEYVSRYEFPLPPVAVQRRVSAALGALDDKIEANARMSETLDAMSSALFRAWFVDFVPVRAKMSGEWRRGETLPGMPAEFWDMFPDAMRETALGEAPAGWRVTTLGDIADAVGGGTPSTREPAYWEGGTHRFATPKDLAKLSTPALMDTERRITDAGLAKISSGLLPVGSVLLSSRAPIGYLAINEVPVAVNQGFIAMKPKPGVSNMFLLRAVESLKAEIESRGNGTTFPEISKRNFRPIPTTLPAPSAVSAFDIQSRALYDRIVANERESRALAAIRDTLLPKLLSGEVKLADV